jgi:hypothetical protein
VRPLSSGHRRSLSSVPSVVWPVGPLAVFLDLVVGSFLGHFFLSLGAYPQVYKLIQFCVEFCSFPNGIKLSPVHNHDIF